MTWDRTQYLVFSLQFHFFLNSGCGPDKLVYLVSVNKGLIKNFASQSPVANQRSSRQQDMIRAPEARLTQQQGDDGSVYS